ncbi:MAG: DUF58 domain-containing protein [Puniceicoccales bacterium]|jgi:uncharacterized protein (DUF58 family)|nr:DUF58 domain-containing protein [Puniceicoccales bacterium]
MTRVKNALVGLYRRMFPSNGVVLGDSREYVPGDDTRFINWNITAKTAVPFVDRICGDRGSDIIFAIDTSESMKFGTKKQSKMALAADIASALTQLAKVNRDKIGLLLFSDVVEKYLQRCCYGEVFHHTIGQTINSGRRLGTDLLSALKFLNKVLRKGSTVIVICDTFALAKNRKATLEQFHHIAKKNDVIVIRTVDDNDIPPANIGKIVVEDGETGETLEIDTGDSVLMAEIFEKYSAYARIIFRDVGDIGVKIMDANTKISAGEFLFTFFKRFI